MPHLYDMNPKLNPKPKAEAKPAPKKPAAKKPAKGKGSR